MKDNLQEKQCLSPASKPNSLMKPICHILAQILTRKHFSLSRLMVLEQVNLTLWPWKKLTSWSYCDKNKKFIVDTVLTKSSWSHTVTGILLLNISCFHYSNCHAVQTRNQITNIQKNIEDNNCIFKNTNT